MDDQSLVTDCGTFARFYTNPSLFLAFTVFTSSVYLFWSFPFKPPRDGFLRGGLKGNDQKKYTLEVKTVKAIKSDGLV